MFEWLQDELHAFFLFVLDSIMSGFAYLVELVPVPDFILNADPVTLPDGIGWFLSAMQFQFGLGVVVTAYVARFILRRIPGIG